MRRLTLLTAIMLVCCCSFAQEKPYTRSSTKNKKFEKRVPHRCPTVFLTASTGINNNAGLLGVGADFMVASHASINVGAGFGTWGKKFCADAKYYLRSCHTGWAFGGGVTYATGENNYTTNMETIYGYMEDVTFNLHPQVNMFVAAYKYWNIGRRDNRFYLELGYSVRITPTRFDQIAGDEIDDTSVKTMNILSPGGIIIGTGFSFGLPRRK